jgi:hypothetical protein
MSTRWYAPLIKVIKEMYMVRYVMTTYLESIPVDLQKELTKKRYLDVLKELTHVTRKLHQFLETSEFHPLNPHVGVRLRVTYSDINLSWYEGPVHNLGKCQIYDVHWGFGYLHSWVPYQKLIKLNQEKT